MGYASTLKKPAVEEERRGGCHAYGCPFPAALSAGAGAPQFCRHHHEVPGVRWPAITEAMLRDHGPLTTEVLSARSYFASGTPGLDDERMADAWARLSRHGYDLDPASCVWTKGQREPARTYRRWSMAAEDLLAKLLRQA